MEPIRDRAGESGRAQPDAESVRAILGSDSVRELVRRLPNALRGTIRCVAYGIQIVDDSPDRVRIVSLLQDEKPPDAEIDAGSNEVREFVEKGYATEESPFSIVLKTGQPVYFADLTTESGFPSILEIWRRSGVRSLLYLPLHFNGTFFGAFFCGSRKTDAFPEATRDLLSMVAELIALSVQNSLSQERTNRSRKALADERDRLQTLLQIAKVASSAMDTGSLMRGQLFTELRKVLHHQSGGGDASAITRKPAISTCYTWICRTITPVPQSKPGSRWRKPPAARPSECSERFAT
ncbi:MAG: GAF domain-containing protein [Bryobacterales bacterium]|nr:GAF domain-containing protein [Bryobacterales bacterium]